MSQIGLLWEPPDCGDIAGRISMPRRLNLGHPGTPVSPEIAAERERLHQRLIHVMETLGTMPNGIVWPKHWGEQREGGRG